MATVNGPENFAWYGVRGRILSSRGSAMVRSTGAATPSSTDSMSAGSSPAARRASAQSMAGWVKWLLG